MQFNKLYNIILQSIIKENKEYRKHLISQTEYNPQQQNWILSWLDHFNNNKLADFLCKFYANGQLTQFGSKDEDKIKKILIREPSIDTQNWTGTLKQFLDKYQFTTKQLEEKEIYSNIDNIPEFTDKEVLSDGVIVYKVQDSKKGQKAVRKVVDLQWGPKTNPWCLIARDSNWNEWEDGNGMEYQAWNYWQKYSGYPKHIAFQNGKLIAFCANENHNIIWWDRNDKKHNDIPLQNGNEIEWKYKWKDDKQIVQYYKKFNKIIKYNQQTKRWDVSGDITLHDEDLIDNSIPIPFGEVEKFAVLDSRKLTSLKNAPTKVKGTFECTRCLSLRDIKDMPKEISGQVIFKACPMIPFERRAGLVYNKETGLWDANYRVYITDNELKDGHLPYKFGKVKGYFSVYDCSKLFSLEGCPEEIPGSFDASCCHNLKSLVGGPKKVGGNFNIAACWELKTLQGAPEYIGGNFNCNDNHYLLSIEGGPKVVKGNINYSWCDNLKSLKGCPDQIGGSVDLNNCQILEDLDKLPSVVKPNKDIITQNCYKLDAWAPYTK